MKNLIVKGKNIPLSGSTNLIVQGEISAEELRYTFNTNSEHSFLSSATTWKLWYKRRDGQGLPVTLTKTTNEDGTWYLSWLPDNHATYLNGQFVYLIAAYSTADDVTPVWKTTPCVINISRSVDPEIIDPEEQTLTYDQIVDVLKAWVTNQKGVASGLASLDTNGKVPSAQLDLSGLDNFETGYYYEGDFYTDAEHTQIMTPKAEAIYIDKGTTPCTLYVYDTDHYKKVGNIDLTNYYTKTEADARYVQKDGSKVLSDNNYTTEEKNKLQGISEGAEVNVQADWQESDSTKDSYIQNKPTIPTSLADLLQDATHRIVTDAEKAAWDAKSVVSASATGTATDEVQYLTINGVEKKLAGGGAVDDVKVNGTSVVTNKVANVTVPTKTSDLDNDSGFLTEHQSLAEYRKSADQDVIDEGKVDKVTGKGLSTEDYTSSEKTKLGALPTNDTLESTYAKKSDISNIYKYMGSVATYADLPSNLTSSDVGKVYNVIAAHGSYPAGTNFAWTWDASTSTGSWDALGGTIDLSVYRTSAAQDTIDATKLNKAVPTEQQGNKEYMYSFAGTTQKTDVALINDMSSSASSYTDRMVPTALSVATVLAGKANNGVIASDYSSSYEYAVGDYCIKDGSFYRCTTAITTPEEWTAVHWTEVKTDSELKQLKNDITAEATARASAVSSEATARENADTQLNSSITALQTSKADKMTVKTTMDSVLVVGTSYYLSEQASLSLTLPASASAGNLITVVFYSGAVPTTLTITGTYLGSSVTPSANSRIEINLLYDGTRWSLLCNQTALTSYTITATLTNATAGEDNPAKMSDMFNATLTYTFDGETYICPSTAPTVTGATGTWTKDSDTQGTLVLSNATGAISYTIEGEAV